MIATREGPDVTVEMRQKLYGYRVRSLRNKIALRHFQFIAFESARSGKQVMARASCSPHMAPEGPPPTIATFDMGRPLAVLKTREFRRESLCEREDRQGKTGAQYSTEDRCRRGTLCLTSHYVHRQSLQHGHNYKVHR